MFIIVLVALAIFGLASLLGSGAGIGFAALLALPILLFKIALVVWLFGFIGRRMWDWDGPRPGPRHRHRRQSAGPARSSEDRFDEWHRMAHAREEVDSWVEDLPGAGPE